MRFPLGCEETGRASTCAATCFFIHLDGDDGVTEDGNFLPRLVVTGEFDELIAVGFECVGELLVGSFSGFSVLFLDTQGAGDIFERKFQDKHSDRLFRIGEIDEVQSLV